ncbi:hypothetical protein NRH57_001087 [Providencia rettgeri]|nr:hypothetical protein [Providencia rettgeri]
MSLELAIKENTEVMRQLIAAMQSGAVVQTNITLKPNEKPQPTKAETKTTTKKETAKTEIHHVVKPVDINTLNLEQIVALAVLFDGNFEELTTEQLNKVDEILAATGRNRNTQADALYMALVNLDEVTNLPNNTIHDLCLEMLLNWSDIPGITERREYALELLSEGKTTSEEPEPEPEPEDIDPKVLFEQAEKLILQLAKGGYRNEAVEILTKFDAKKLGQVPEGKLAEVIELAKKVLGG